MNVRKKNKLFLKHPKTKGLIILMAQQALFNFEVNSTMWSIHDNVLLMITHTKLVVSVLVIIQLEAKIFILISLSLLAKNCRKCVLS